MTQFHFGGGPADWATQAVTVSGTTLLARFKPGAKLTCHWSQGGDDQITDLADASGAPITDVVIPETSEVYGPGQWPRFRAPAPVIWVSVDGGPRFIVVTTDVPQLAAQAREVADAAVVAAQEAASAAREAASNSALPAHLEAPDPHPGYLDAARGDVRYQQRWPEQMPPLTEPIEILQFTSTPPYNAANVRETWVNHNGVWRMVRWSNERNYDRYEVVEGAKWDSPITIVMAYDATGRAILVQRRGVDNQRVNIGGIDAAGRPVTSDQTWVAILDVDPDDTGDYAASSTVGPAPLGARWDTDDVVRLQGWVACAGITSGDTILALPTGFLPLSRRLLALPTTTGPAVSCELNVAGELVARATVAGPLELSLDDVTYARVIAEQDTGGWEISYAGSATPGGTSPLTITRTVTAGRFYVLALAHTTATGRFTGVTDSASNAWALDPGGWAPQSGGVGRQVAVYTCQPAASGEITISIAFTGAGTAYASLYEVDGHDPVAPIDDVVADFRSSSLTPAPLLITPSGPGRLLIGICQANNNTVSQMTPSAGWTMLGTHSAGPAVVYKVDAPVEAQGVAWEFGAAQGSGHALIAIKPE
ncbi:hypothetical protein [Verrucosispora sp. TAA-831]|uniref:hypothetical protein n=1 Tax=Verrucosispora sp. TAA-831 TaxID=3422227 RepID=UPI003D6E3C5E